MKITCSFKWWRFRRKWLPFKRSNKQEMIMTKFQIITVWFMNFIYCFFVCLFVCFTCRILVTLFIVAQKGALQRNLFWWWTKTKRYGTGGSKDTVKFLKIICSLKFLTSMNILPSGFLQIQCESCVCVCVWFFLDFHNRKLFLCQN